MCATVSYLAQDNMTNSNTTNAADNFAMTLQSCILHRVPSDEINQKLRYEDVGGGVAAIYQNTAAIPSIVVLIHCRCKLGIPHGNPKVVLESVTSLRIIWPGARRIFIRTRIMENTTFDVLMDMLRDDIRSRHSVSDVEHPETDQSFRPWSDHDDSETETLGDED